MPIVGVGVDALEIARMQRALERTPSLAGRLFTERERAACVSRCGDVKFGGLAARFAAKEAVAKAFGTGIRGFAWREVEVVNDELGKPAVVLHGAAAAKGTELGVSSIHLSLSTSTDLAVANVVAESA